MANADRFVELFKGVLRYVPKWRAWIYYEDGRWQRDDAKASFALGCAIRTARILRQEADGPNARRWARETQKKVARVKAMVTLATADPRVRISHEVFDRDPLLFNCQNGTLDLRTGKLQPHASGDYITKIAPVAYSPTAKAPTWARVLATSLPDSTVRAYVQRFLGYCISGDVGERVVVMFVGKGRNGKSLIAKAVQEAMGPYAATMVPTVLMATDQEQHPTEIADLFGVRLAVTSEVRKGRAIDEEKFKRLAGNDTLKARRMREDPWEFEPSHKALFLANHRPRVGRDPAVWDRLNVVEFGVRIPDNKVDAKLSTKLRAEREGILAWLVKGHRLYKRQGLKPPQPVKTTTDAYQASEDRLKAFFDSRCSLRPKATVSSDALKTAVKGWCEDHCLKIPHGNELADRLRDLDCAPRHTNKGNVWDGIELLEAKKSRKKPKKPPKRRVKAVKPVKGFPPLAEISRRHKRINGERPSPASPPSPPSNGASEGQEAAE